MAAPELIWDLGTAYDFFVSLEVLHFPSRYGVRGVWAAGMRSRLPNADREFLEESIGSMFFGVPLYWVYKLPPPKDSATAIRALEKTEPARRIVDLYYHPSEEPNGWDKTLMAVLEGGKYTDEDIDTLRALGKGKGEKIARKDIEKMLSWWAQPQEFGERLLKALQAYYEVFFAEEERRIYPALQDALSEAQELASKMTVGELVEELSQGVSFVGDKLDMTSLILAPSFWSSPLIYFGGFSKDETLILYGGRPEDASLIPGEAVPDSLLRGLKALSDPTRLKIMYYLSTESLTPTQLSHRLRLRAPTVVHHLQNLRVAGLVQVNISEGKERSYGARVGAVFATCEALRRYLDLAPEQESIAE